MSIAFTNIAQYDDSIPNTSQAVTPDGAPSQTHWGRDVYNGLYAAYQATKATFRWSGEVRSYNPRANTGAIGVFIGNIEAIALYNSSTTKWQTFTEVGTTNISIGASTLSNATWYYIYAYISGGAVAFEVTTTGPDNSGTDNWQWKHSAYGTHRFVGCFLTENSSGSALVMPFRSIHGQFRYAYTECPASGANSLFPWGSIVGPGTTTLTLGPDGSMRVPGAGTSVSSPKAMRTYWKVFAANIDAAVQTIHFRFSGTEYGGTAGTNPFRLDCPLGNSTHGIFSLDTGNNSQIQIIPSDADLSVTAELIGFDLLGCP